MFNIENDTLYFTRGDTISFNLSIDGYMFQPNDKIAFRIYERSRLNQAPLSETITTVEEATASIKITLLPEATRVGQIINKPIEYWYEIELNDDQTVIGYDENGPKVIVLYPEGEISGDGE